MEVPLASPPPLHPPAKAPLAPTSSSPLSLSLSHFWLQWRASNSQPWPWPCFSPRQRRRPWSPSRQWLLRRLRSPSPATLLSTPTTTSPPVKPSTMSPARLLACLCGGDPCPYYPLRLSARWQHLPTTREVTLCGMRLACRRWHSASARSLAHATLLPRQPCPLPGRLC